MPSRIYRRRPPKDGGTHATTTGDTPPLSRQPHLHKHIHPNYYQPLSSDFPPLHPNKHQLNTTMPNPHSLRHSHRSQIHFRSTDQQPHEDLDGFTLIKKLRNKIKIINKTKYTSSQSIKNSICKSSYTPKQFSSMRSAIATTTLAPTIKKNYYSGKTFNSLLASTTVCNPNIPIPVPATMSSVPPSTTPPDAPPIVSPSDVGTKTTLTIDSTTDDSKIFSVPIADTWNTYVFNASDPSFSEDEWNNLSDQDKHHALLCLKKHVHDITSPFTTYVITRDTDNAVITNIPMKDCKLLLTAYATNQGFSHFTSRLDSMSVESMRAELLKAQQKLSARIQDQPSNTKKSKNITVPFVLTHETKDSDILSTPENDLLNELKSMYTDRNIQDSVEWDSLSLSDLQDMVRIERDAMRKCIRNDTKVKKENERPATQPAGTNKQKPEIIHIEDEDSDDDTDFDDDGDAKFEDATDESPNESDKFVQEQLGTMKREQKTFKFKFTHETSNDDVYMLSHRRAIRIAIAHSQNIGEPLPQSFIDNVTTDEVHSYLLHERDEFIYQHEYDIFNFTSLTTDTDMKQLTRLQLENFLIFRYRDTDRIINDEFFTNKTDMELKCLLISERDIMKNEKKASTEHTKNSNDPTPPNTLPKGLFGKRQNLNGWNINSALSKNNNNIHSKVFHPSSTNETDPDVVTMAKNNFFIRANISTVGNGSHIPTIVRKFFKALRNSDPTMQLQPFDIEDNDLDHILDTESLIPDDPTQILTWVRGVTTTPKRIHFSIRVSNICLLSELRTDIFGWCKTNRCWIDMDYINSEKLFACGWICGLHPRLYNRNDLKE